MIFAYGAITRSGRPFQAVRLISTDAPFLKMMQPVSRLLRRDELVTLPLSFEFESSKMFLPYDPHLALRAQFTSFTRIRSL